MADGITGVPGGSGAGSVNLAADIAAQTVDPTERERAVFRALTQETFLSTSDTFVTWILDQIALRGTPISVGQIQGFGQSQTLCRVTRVTAQSIGDSSDTAVTFTAAQNDPSGMWSAGTPTRVNITVPGFYIAAASTEWASNTTGIRVTYQKATGTNNLARDRRSASADLASCSVVWGGQLSEGEYLEVYVVQTSGGSLNLSSCDFAVARVGSAGS